MLLLVGLLPHLLLDSWRRMALISGDDEEHEEVRGNDAEHVDSYDCMM
jgi:hypothetical protein